MTDNRWPRDVTNPTPTQVTNFETDAPQPQQEKVGAANLLISRGVAEGLWEANWKLAMEENADLRQQLAAKQAALVKYGQRVEVMLKGLADKDGYIVLPLTTILSRLDTCGLDAAKEL